MSIRKKSNRHKPKQEEHDYMNMNSYEEFLYTYLQKNERDRATLAFNAIAALITEVENLRNEVNLLKGRL